MILDDITDFVEQCEHRERVMDQLVSTILRVVGRQDPFTAEHAGRATEMLQGVKFDGNVAETIRQAHERWDGEGEPRVLKGEAILESAWVVAVADALTCTISARPIDRACPWTRPKKSFHRWRAHPWIASR
jgi:HD-GYP domain-containing protein (c-di-GMP phosphodiesterase class II)